MASACERNHVLQDYQTKSTLQMQTHLVEVGINNGEPMHYRYVIETNLQDRSTSICLALLHMSYVFVVIGGGDVWC